ncbi:adenylate kinase [Dioszegia hungarica]|uniref:Adenylate kinase n=1 Tax=Dioszegia hungarica TaxID=4972 RepID=A0AA38HEZ1_9TREE|nr:adenylate kinase [Dioszegia hungarica]KAI9638692.1 adenylate kinase [Dioszegia hungarica]
MSASTSRLTQAVRPASFRILQPRVLSGRVPSLPLRTISTSSPRGTVSDSISSVVQRMRELVAQERKGWVEGDQEREKGLRMLMFGKPGSGKLICRLLKLYDIAFVSTGDVLRKEIAAKSPLGLRAEEVVRTGGLVSDELMLEIVKTELDRLRGRSWIIDGFPRTLHQGKLLDDVLNEEGRPLNMIVHLNVPDSVIMARISARWVHLPSGRVYNTTYSAPKVEGVDDVTGEPLIKRPDDTPEVFTKRLKAYYDSTAPLLEYFSSAYPESLHSLSGSTSDEVLFASGLYAAPPPPPILASARERDRDPPLSSTSTKKRENQSDAMSSSSSSSSTSATSPRIDTPSSSTEPKSSHTLLSSGGTDATTTLDQLWPQLQELVEPFGLRRRDPELPEEEAGKVREKADDLRDPEKAERKGV